MARNKTLKDMTGQFFGKWRVIEQYGNTRHGCARWLCVCACGEQRPVLGQDLRAGKSKSCGCDGSRSHIGNRAKKHGATGTRLHRIWVNMRKRCRDINDKRYGGRGIRICPEWDKFTTFQSWALETGYSDSLSIERIDVNGNYTPDNCCWATPQQQSENRRFVAKNKDGKLWWHVAKENGITQGAYRSRLHEGWPIELAATAPMHSRLKNLHAL